RLPELVHGRVEPRIGIEHARLPGPLLLVVERVLHDIPLRSGGFLPNPPAKASWRRTDGKQQIVSSECRAGALLPSPGIDTTEAGYGPCPSGKTSRWPK